MTDAPHTAFEPLDFRKRVLVQTAPNQYRVQAPSGEIHEVQAATAYEAFRQSGVGEAIKIERIFINRHHVLPRERFLDNEDFTPPSEFDELLGSAMDEKDPLALFRRRKTPIISAVELDALMRALHAMETEEHPGPEVMQDNLPASPASPVRLETVAGPAQVPGEHNERISIPSQAIEEAHSPASSEASLTGMDVQGDGFDEIIPAAAFPNPAKPAPKGDRQIPPVAPADVAPLPERELSEEEIDALLNRK